MASGARLRGMVREVLAVQSGYLRHIHDDFGCTVHLHSRSTYPPGCNGRIGGVGIVVVLVVLVVLVLVLVQQ